MGIEQRRRGCQPFPDQVVVVGKVCVIAAQLSRRRREADDVSETTYKEFSSSETESDTFRLVSAHRDPVQPVQVGRPRAMACVHI